MGDFNNTLTDGVLSHLLTKSLRFVSKIDQDTYLAKYCLNDAWNLFKAVRMNEEDHSDDGSKNQLSEHNLVKSNDTDIASDINIDCKIKTLSRKPTHYFGGGSSVLDYILLSCEFDASNQTSLYQVSAYDTYDRHLINPVFDRDGESTDHGIVSVTLSLRS